MVQVPSLALQRLRRLIACYSDAKEFLSELVPLLYPSGFSPGRLEAILPSSLEAALLYKCDTYSDVAPAVKELHLRMSNYAQVATGLASLVAAGTAQAVPMKIIPCEGVRF